MAAYRRFNNGLNVRSEWVVWGLPGKAIFQDTRGARSVTLSMKRIFVNRAIGEYKGWQLKLHEWPDGIDDFDWNT